MPNSIYCVLAGAQSAQPVLARVGVSTQGLAAGGAGRTDLSDANVAHDDVSKSIQDAEQLLFESLEGINVSRIFNGWLSRGALAQGVIGVCGAVLLLSMVLIVPGGLALLGVSVDTSGWAGWPERARAVATAMLAVLSLAGVGLLFAARRSLRECRALVKGLRSQKRTITLLDPQTGDTQSVFYSGNSGGLAFLLALLSAALKPQQIAAWFPWVYALLRSPAQLVCTAAVTPNGRVGRVGEINVKLGAIRPDADTFWILSTENMIDVQDYYRASPNDLCLENRRYARGNWQFYRSRDQRHAFLFISRIDDLADFFAPRTRASRQGAVAGVLCACLAMLGAWLVPASGAPEFTLSQCGLGAQAVASHEEAKMGVWEDDQTILECVVTLKANNAPGPLELDVRSSAGSLLPGDAQAAEGQHMTRHLSATSHYSFFVRQTDVASGPGYVIVGVVARNMAGRQSSAAVVLPLQPSPAR
jgi:hypothetical protein